MKKDEELDRRREDAYLMGQMSTKIDILSDALRSHMMREEDITKTFRADIKRLNKYVYILIGSAIFQAPTTVVGDTWAELLRAILGT